MSPSETIKNTRAGRFPAIIKMKLDESIDLYKTESDARAAAYAAAADAIRAIRPLTADIFELLTERDDEADALRSALGKLAAARCAASLDAENRHLARISADDSRK